MRHTTTARTTALLLTASAAALALTSCSSRSGDHRWSTASEMSEAPESVSVPTLVASDATDIRLSTPAFGKGLTAITWQSERGVTRSDCTAGSLGQPPVAGAPSWWPERVPEEGQRCGWWRVFEQDGAYFAWQQLSRTGA